jgi:hypothetical protein
VTWFDNASNPGSWDDFEVYYKKSTDGGNNWTSSKRLTWATKQFRNPNIAIDASDNIHIAWYRSDVLDEVYYKNSLDNGNTWKGSKRLTWEDSSFYPSRYPDIVTDSKKNIYIVYQHQVPSFPPGSGANVEIFFRKSENAGTIWNPQKRITWRGELSYYPKTIIDSGNNIHIVWVDERTGNWEIFYKKGIL